MCPLCVATAALIAASTISTGGAMALVVPKFFRVKDDAKKGTKKSFQKQNPKEETWEK